MLMIVPQVLSAPVDLSSSQNSAIPVPEGTTNHGDPHLLCTRSTWSNVATFYLANYVAHAATVKSEPGQLMLRGVLSMLLALVLPTSGVLRGLDAIRRHAIIGGSPLQKARKAGALCEVVRTEDWEPQRSPGDLVQRVRFKHARDEHNLAEIEMILEAGKRWVATKPSWLKKIDVQRDYKLDPIVIRLLDRWLAPGVKHLLHGEGRLVRWYLYAAIIFNNRVSRKLDNLELVDRPKKTRNPDASKTRTTQPRVTIFPKIRIVGLGGREVFEPSHKMLDLTGRKLHGTCCLPPGYKLAIVPHQSIVEELNDPKSNERQTAPSDTSNSIKTSSSAESDISWSYSFAKALVATFQALYACATLYEARGDQIERYGYAAFGLTVAPYLVMSIINLIGTVVTPDYSTLFMVESEIMEEAKRRDGACFRGTVGKLAFKQCVNRSFNATFKIDDQDRTVVEVRDSSEYSEETPQMFTHQDGSTDDSRALIIPACHEASEDASHVRDLFNLSNWIGSLTDYILSLFLATVVGLVSVAINGCLTHFKAGESTHAQRVWTMTWLASGIYYGTTEPIFDIVNSWELRYWNLIIGRLGLFFIGCAPAIGGLVVVGQMLMSYGHCIQI